jgi:hypothetical protein
VVFRLADGASSTRSCWRCWNVPFEWATPARSFPAYRGQKSFAGLWWSATLGDHVGYKSWLERDHAMLLDFDPEWWRSHRSRFGCTGPLRSVRGGMRQTSARLTDGTRVVIDVRADNQVDPDAAEAFAATERACTAESCP